MKLNNFWIKYLLALEIGFLSLAAYADEDSVDFARLNPVLQALVDEASAHHRTLSDVKVRFDENASHLEDEKLKYHLSASLHNTPWNPDGRGELESVTQFQTSRARFHIGIDVETTIKLSTDIRSFWKHAGKIALDKMGNARNERERSESESEERSLYTQLKEANTLEELATVLRKGKTYALQEIQKAKTEAEIELRQAHNTDRSIRSAPRTREITYLNDKTERFRNQMARLSASDITLVGDAEIVVENKDLAGFFKREHYTPFESGRASVKFTPNDLEIQVSIFHPTTLHKLDELKNDLRTNFQGAQQGVAHNEEWIRNKCRNALKEFKRAVWTRDQEPESD